MADSRVFRQVEGVNVADIAREVEFYLRNNKGMVSETIEAPNGYLVQAKQDDKIKKFVGMGLATHVQIIPTGDIITVNVGEAKWADKAGAAAAGVLIFYPLLITAGIGAWQQRKLPEEIFDVVERFISSGGRSVYAGYASSGTVSPSAAKPAAEDKIECPNCHAMNDKGQNFCSNCGEKLTLTCPHCNAEVPLGTKFCPVCGKDVSKTKVCSNCGNEMTEDEKFCSKCGTKVE